MIFLTLGYGNGHGTPGNKGDDNCIFNYVRTDLSHGKITGEGYGMGESEFYESSSGVGEYPPNKRQLTGSNYDRPETK
jgi:hypothetical protein